MRKDVKSATSTIANLLPGLISGVELDFFARTNITNSQFITLIAIYNSGRCTMGYLAERLHVTMPTVTGLIDRLIKLRLVARRPSIEDRRKVYVELSKKGIGLITEFKVLVRRRWGRLLSVLTPAEVEAYQNVLKRIHLYIQEHEGENED